MTQLEKLKSRLEPGKHTPGPWVIIPATPYEGEDGDLQGGYTSPAGIEGTNGDPVCVFGIAEGSGHLFENEADYHLIAAAPELLSALIEAKREMWLLARQRWTMADFKNWAVVQQIDAALERADRHPRTVDAIAKAEAGN